MKRIKRLIIIFVTFLLLSGCVKNNVTMRINNDKTMSLEVTLLVKDEKKNQLDSMFNSYDLEDRGFKVSTLTKDDYSGYKITRDFSNLDELSSGNNEEIYISNVLFEDFDFSKLFTKKSSFFKDTYSAKFKYTTDAFKNMFSVEDDKILEEQYSESLSSLDEIELKYILVLPTKAISNDANEVSSDFKYLSWQLSKSEESNINYSFNIYNTKNIIILGCSGLLFIILIIVIIIVIKKKKSSKATLIYKEYDPSIEGELNNKEIIDDKEKVDNIEQDSNIKTADMIVDENEGMQVLPTLEFELQEEKMIDVPVEENQIVENKTIDNQIVYEDQIQQQPMFIYEEQTIINSLGSYLVNCQLYYCSPFAICNK